MRASRRRFPIGPPATTLRAPPRRASCSRLSLAPRPVPLLARPRAALVIAALALSPWLASAQPLVGAARTDSLRDSRLFSFYARGPYRAQVPRPEALLGFRFGDRNAQYAEQERVLLAIADAAKDRVRVEEIGATHEGRRMRLYIVSAAENIARLDAVRADLDRIADPRGAGTCEGRHGAGLLYTSDAADD